jgi:hypothetical protein
LGIKSDSALAKRIKQGIIPQPVTLNGVCFWYAAEIEACVKNLPRGPGRKPVAALAERARRIAIRKRIAIAKAGRTNGPIFFTRGKGAPR